MKKNLSAFLITVLCLCTFALVFSACDSGGGGGGGGGGGSSSPASLKIPLPGGDRAAGDNLWVREDTAYFKVSLSSSRYKASKTGNLGGVVEFSNIPVGDYTVIIEGKDKNGNSVSRGIKNATVKVGVTSSVTIDLGYLEYCTVSFNSGIVTPTDSITNNGSMDPVKVTKGEEFKLPECGFHPYGMTFYSWDRVVDPNGGTEPAGAAGDEYLVTDDITLKARWSATVNIYAYVEPGYGYGSLVDTQNVVCGNLAVAPTSCPPRTGYIFTGWRTGEDGDDVSFNFNGDTISGAKTVYGGWRPCLVTSEYGMFAFELTGLSYDPEGNHWVSFQSLNYSGVVVRFEGSGLGNRFKVYNGSELLGETSIKYIDSNSNGYFVFTIGTTDYFCAASMPTDPYFAGYTAGCGENPTLEELNDLLP